MFSMFLLKQVKYLLADKNTCVILCEFLNKVYIFINYYYYYYYYYYYFSFNFMPIYNTIAEPIPWA